MKGFKAPPDPIPYSPPGTGKRTDHCPVCGVEVNVQHMAAHIEMNHSKEAPRKQSWEKE